MIALIPARGGSQRIKRKNLIPICGHPLVAWSIVQAKSAHGISLVVVTTDDEEIAEVSRAYGADIVVPRPHFDDGVTAGKAYCHALEWLEGEGIPISARHCSLLPTSPLKRPDDIDRLIKLATQVGANHAFPVIPMKEMALYVGEGPYQDRFGTKTQGDLYPIQNYLFDKLWTYSMIAGGWACSDTSWIRQTWIERPALDIDLDTGPLDPFWYWGYKVPEWMKYELDYPEDIPMVEMLMEQMILKGHGMNVYHDYKEGPV